MATRLEEIRAQLLQKEQQGSFSGSSGSKEVYPFWNIPEGKTATLRFLDDGNPDNTFFWVERQILKLPFDGIKGGDSKEVIVQVPCVEMWEPKGSCPILSEVRAWFKDPELEAMGRKYWVKRSYLFQGFVVNDPMNEQDAPENPIRRFVINKSIYEIIKSSLMNPEMDESPTDFIAGRDFKIAKTKRGQYADYSTSGWSMNTRPLDDDELEAVNNPEWGLKDLSNYLPRKPNAAALAIIKEMFEASVNGDAYDESLWASHYRPVGMNRNDAGNGNTSSAPAPAKPTPSVTADVADSTPAEEATKAEVASPVLENKTTDEKPDPKKIIEMLRQRNADK